MLDGLKESIAASVLPSTVPQPWSSVVSSEESSGTGVGQRFALPDPRMGSGSRPVFASGGTRSPPGDDSRENSDGGIWSFVRQPAALASSASFGDLGGVFDSVSEFGGPAAKLSTAADEEEASVAPSRAFRFFADVGKAFTVRADFTPLKLNMCMLRACAMSCISSSWLRL